MILFKLIQLKRCRRYSVASFFYLLGFILFGRNNAVFAQSKERSEIIYKITDPRNPNCPCHKYQKRAEKEYGLLKKSAVLSKKDRGLIFFLKADRESLPKRLNLRRKTGLRIKKQKSVKRKGVLFNKGIDACPF